MVNAIERKTHMNNKTFHCGHRGQHQSHLKPFRWTKKARSFCEAMALLDNASAAAREARINERYATRLKKKPEIQAEIAKRRERKQAAVDQQEAKKIVIDRDSVVIKLWKLAQLPPLATNLNISGQVKALSEIAEILGLKVTKTFDVTEKFRGKTTEELEHYAVHGFFPGENPPEKP